MAVQIDRLLVVLIPTRVTVERERDKVQKYRFDRSDILKKTFWVNAFSFFLLDCRGIRKRRGYVIIVQANELEREMGSVPFVERRIFFSH